MAGTEFNIDLKPGGTSATVDAASAVARLASQLESAQVATLAANEAVKAAQASYASAESAADRAAKAVEKVTAAADAQRGKLDAALKIGDVQSAERIAGKLNTLVIAQLAATQKADEAKSAMVEEAKALDKLSAAADQAKTHEEQLAKAHGQAKTAAVAVAKANDAAGGSGKFGEMAEGLGKLGGPLGSAGQKAFGAAEGLKKLFSSAGSGAGPYVALAVAIVAVTTALIVGTVAMLKYGIATSDAARSSQLLSDGIAGSVAGGRELDAAIYKLGAKVPQTADELRTMAGELAKSGLKGAALSDALEEAAVKAAKVKYGPDFAKQTLSLGNQTARLHQNIAGLFGGLNLESFLGGISKIIAMFDSTSATGRAIKVVFESLFQPLVDGIASVAPKVVALFIQFEIWALKGLIAIKPYGSTFLLVGKIIGGVALAVTAALVVVVGIVVALGMAMAGLVAGAIYLGTKLFGLAADAAVFAASLVAGPGGAIDWLIAKFNEVVTFLRGLSLAEIGKAMIDGLVAGITGGAAGVAAAVTGAVGGAVDAAKNLLGIASPSKVFATIGMQTAAGMTQGIEAGAGDVQSSLTSMADPQPAASLGGGASGGGRSVHIENLVIQAPGGDAPSIAAAVREVLLDILEGDAAHLGLVEASV